MYIHLEYQNITTMTKDKTYPVRYSQSDIDAHGGLANLKKAILAARNLDKDALDQLTARLSKEAQQNAMEKSAERVNDNV